MNEQFGFKVIMKHKKFGDITIRNVTEIHYKYKSLIPDKDMVAFESDIHRTSRTDFAEYILEFEATLETKKEKDFYES